MEVIGNAAIIIVISYILAGLSTRKTLKVSQVITIIIAMIILHLILLR